jgi:hypothetical protein
LADRRTLWALVQLSCCMTPSSFNLTIEGGLQIKICLALSTPGDGLDSARGFAIPHLGAFQPGPPRHNVLPLALRQLSICILYTSILLQSCLCFRDIDCVSYNTHYSCAPPSIATRRPTLPRNAASIRSQPQHKHLLIRLLLWQGLTAYCRGHIRWGRF